MRRVTSIAVAVGLAAAGAALAPANASAGACDEVVADAIPYKWMTPHHVLHFNTATFAQEFPGDVQFVYASIALQNSMRTWNSELTDCAFLVQAPAKYEHTIMRGPDTALVADAWSRDNVSVVDFGTFSGQPEWDPCHNGGCLAAAQVFVDCPVKIGTHNCRSPNQILESDVRFDWYWEWHTNRSGSDYWAPDARGCDPGRGGQFDLWSVGAHEFGHTLGFKHAPGPAQTMYGIGKACDPSPRSLGAADIYGYRSYYPPEPQ